MKIFQSENLKERDNFGRPRDRLENNIKMDLTEIGCGSELSGSG
jgi:hypothetical protein